ncbi:MAG: DUF445 domain-containing protein [Ilumatobacter sp.]|uniref:DUF445 domain-containing protein n=3 Tax=Ilumatobacter sp. TaxID=1967498 RepID=UPI0032968EE8
MTASMAATSDQALLDSPVDAGRRHDLRRMKTVATALLVVAAVIYVVAKINEDSATWVGYVRAVAEAAMVGALADWFAVTALFRHPLGLPIPHTAIIRKRKDDIGRSLGDFVESNFLTVEVIDERLRGAEIGRRAGEWLADPSHAERAGDAIADVVRGGLEVLDDGEIQAGLEHVVRTRIDATQVAPLVGRAVELTADGGYVQRLLDGVLSGLGKYLDDNRETLRKRLHDESPRWVPERIDDRVFAKVYDIAERLITDVRSSPDHELRSSVDVRVADLAHRLRHDPEMHAKGEVWKQELLDHPEVRRWIESLWGEVKQGMLSAADDRESELRRRIVGSLQQLGHRLATEPELQTKVDEWVASALGHLVVNYRTEVSEIISSTVERWDAESTADKLELQVGRDLQFIRINGTIVGGMAGFVIHAVGQLL